MFLQILMLTRQNKCHAAYFFNTCVFPNGFLCSEVLTECVVLWMQERQSWKATQRGDLPGLPGNSSARGRLICGTSEVGSTLARLLTDTSTERDNVLPGSFILPREATWKRP